MNNNPQDGCGVDWVSICFSFNEQIETRNSEGISTVHIVEKYFRFLFNNWNSITAEHSTSSSATEESVAHFREIIKQKVNTTIQNQGSSMILDPSLHSLYKLLIDFQSYLE